MDSQTLFGTDHGIPGFPGLLPPQLPAFLLQRRHTHNVPVIRAALEPSRGDGSSSPTAPDSSQLSSSSSLGGAAAPSSMHFSRPIITSLVGIDVVDIWSDHTPPPFCNLPNSYSFLVKHSILWRLSYQIIQPRLVHLPYLATVKAICNKGISAAFDKYQPDLLVSVHPLMQHVPLWILRSRIKAGTYRPINFATVVTDFTTCHNTWFAPGVTRCFVPTEFCKKLGLRQGLNEDQISTYGLPIRPIFSKRLAPKRSLKRQLGLDPDVPAILLVGGGEGMGALEVTVEQMALKLGTRCQMVVICGRNKKLLDRIQGTQHASGMRVLACGFVDNIHEWMAASDCIITKAGPGTIAEALIAGLPILLNGNIPCQEEGNIPYVIDNGVGAFEKQPAKIADIVVDWLGEGEAAFKDMARKAKALGRPEAVYKIVHDLAQLADLPCLEWGPAATNQKNKKPTVVVQRRHADRRINHCATGAASGRPGPAGS
ncbi:MAG: hypothetical protein WDW38_005136 [Sanguina aurantia]